MAIEQVAAVRVKEHEAALEQAIATAITDSSRVRSVFKQLSVTSAGLDPCNGPRTTVGLLTMHGRFRRLASEVTTRTASPIGVDEILERGKDFIGETLVGEDEYLLDRLIGAASSPHAKGQDRWSAVLTPSLGLKTVGSGDDWKFVVPQTLLSLVSGEPDDADSEVLKKRNVAVVTADDRVCKARSATCAGLLISTDSDGFTLRIEKDWRMMWEVADGPAIDLVLEAFWYESVRHGDLLRFV